jgi:hypothetical protein
VACRTSGTPLFAAATHQEVVRMADQQTSSQPLVGRGRIQGVALVMIFGFLVMGILTASFHRR